jgi:hypothetical protein
VVPAIGLYEKLPGEIKTIHDITDFDEAVEKGE